MAQDDFAVLACDLQVSPSALAIRLQELHLVDPAHCARLRKMSAAQAASIAGQAEEFAVRVAIASTPRPPGLLVRDAYLAYESGRHHTAPLRTASRSGR